MKSEIEILREENERMKTALVDVMKIWGMRGGTYKERFFVSLNAAKRGLGIRTANYQVAYDLLVEQELIKVP